MTIVKITPYLFSLTNPILKPAGADRFDGNDYNRLTFHWSRLIRIEGNPPDASYTPLVDEAFIWVDTTNGNVTIALPAANQSAGKAFMVFKSASANTVTIDADASELINNVSTLTITAVNGWAVLTCDGVQWKAMLPAAPASGADEKTIVFLNGAQVGPVARRINFQTTFTVVE
ncbi:MAG: hypothetical protein ACRD88_07595, partial [Terriglobia bacterium]